MLLDCNAYDLILVQPIEKGAVQSASCSTALFHSADAVDESAADQQCFSVHVLIVSETGDVLRFPVIKGKIRSSELAADNNNVPATTEHDEDALVQIASHLQPGRNSARYLLMKDEDIVGIAPFHIYLWTPNRKVCVVDVDGTITKSTMRGFLVTAVCDQDAYCHAGVCEFLQSLRNDNLGLVYVTNRPIAYANKTRKFLTNLRQQTTDKAGQQHQLPAGPLIGFTGGLAGVFKMDFFHRNAHVFKHDILQNHVARPFYQQGATNIFYAGFGNTLSDMHAYHRVGIDPSRMFLIDKKSLIYSFDAADDVPEDNPKRQFHRLPSDYSTARGTSFDGYTDEKLRSHVLGPDRSASS